MGDGLWLELPGAVVALSALGGLGLSIYNHMLLRRQGKAASVFVRLVSTDKRSCRLLVVNNGPHDAEDVDVTLQGRGGGKPRGVVQITNHSTQAHLPIPRLHFREELFIPGTVHFTLGCHPAEVHVKWRDGRRGAQERTQHVSEPPPMK